VADSQVVGAESVIGDQIRACPQDRRNAHRQNRKGASADSPVG
jgi:hypothetical protein